VREHVEEKSLSLKTDALLPCFDARRLRAIVFAEAIGDERS
jgi:hypothetical protein